MLPAPIPATPAPAHWSPVRTQRLAASPALLSGSAFAPSGRGFLALSPQTRGGRTVAAYRAANLVRVIGPSGGIGRTFRLPWASGSLGDQAARDGSTAVVASPSRTPRTVTVSDLTPTGRLLRTQSIAAPDRLDPYATICSGTSGDAVVVWSERKGRKGSTTLAMARRPARGRLSARIALSTTTPWTYDCSVAPDGRWIVAAAIRPAAGDPTVPRLRVWTGSARSPARHRIDLGDAPYSTILETAIDGRGRSFVVWRSQLPDSGFGAGPDEIFRVRAASVGPDGRTATPTQVLESGEGNGGAGRLAVSPTGGAALEISLPQLEEDTGKPSPGVALTVAGADGTFSPLTAPIPGADSQGPVAYRSDGTPIVTWPTPDGAHQLAAPLTGTALGPVEDTGLPGSVALATSTRSGEPRLYAYETTKTGTTLRSATRRAP